METSSITAKGQVTIPARIRKALGLKAGAKVAFKMNADAITLVPVLDDVSAAFGLLKSNRAVTNEAIDQAASQAAVERYQP